MLGIVLLTYVYLLHVSLPAGGVQIRLVGGNGRCSGRVEIYRSDQWGTVCDDNWDLNDATVVCRQLGCGTALSAPGGAQFGQGSGETWMDEVGCTGSESLLSQCSHNGYGTEDCNHSEDAGVICSASRVRLVGGNGRCSGRVEVYHSDQWGTVCDDNWGLNDAAVVCRQLGCGTALSAPGGAQFGQGSGETWMDEVGCTGSESLLSQCSHNGYGTEDCNHSEDAGVICSGVPVRLFGGKCQCSGRVEVYYSNQWGTVCDDNWGLNDATVVCRELGCGTAVSAPGGAPFGQGSGQIWMDEVGCTGNEGSLSQCSHNGYGTQDCDHSEDAGVICSGAVGNMRQPTLSLSSSHTALSPGDEVRFRCAAPADFCAPVEFNLYRGNAESPLVGKSEKSETSTVLVVNNLDTSHQGSYTCLYTVQGSQTLRSSKSNSISIRVVVLPQPTIVLSSPQGSKVMMGQSFTITCSTAPQHSGGSFQLSFTGSGVTKTEAAVSHSASFIFSAAELSHQGTYSCVYELTVSGRKFSSPASTLLTLTVTVVLQQPTIVLSSPQGSEVMMGQSFTITCSTAPQYSGGSFQLSFTGSGVTKTEAAVSHSASFIFSAAELSHQGTYSCVYELTVSGRKFSSPASTLLTLTVTESLILPVALGVSLGLLLLVLLPLVLFLVFQKRKHRLELTQVPKTASNECTMNAYFTKGKASQEVEEEDYENIGTLTGNDYEDQMEGEDSGSEGDYMNYCPPIENKYEDEDIYQN